MSCCGKDAKDFNFQQVYQGFNEDIYNDIYGRKKIDPCCTNNLASCRQGDQYSNGCNSGLGGKKPDYADFNKLYMSCDAGPMQSDVPLNGCCPHKSQFKPLEVYHGFNQNLFFDTNGGSCIGTNDDKDKACKPENYCRHQY